MTDHITAEEYRIAARVLRARCDYGEHIAKGFDVRADDIEHAINTAAFNRIVGET